MKLELVHFMPEEFDPGTLYVSEEYGIAIHLCPCGCRNKVATPIGPPHGWDFEVSDEGPTLHPSVGSFQLPCKSHYWIRAGKVVWA